MARYLEQANECTDPTTGDFLWVYDASAGATDKDRKVNISRFAILANAQTFTGAQTIAPAAGTVALTLTAPANQTSAMLSLTGSDSGSGFGPHISFGRNTNATTSAAGFLFITNRGGTGYSIWPDNSGNLRTNGAELPTSANDTSGTVVGAQTSYAALKEDIAPWDGAGALDALLACKLFGYRFKGDESKRQYHGIVINDDDRGTWLSENDAANQTPALNQRNLFGHLIAAIQAQQAQIEELRAQVTELKLP
jgi:hypothetical protein